jgi:hypothetical protein
MEYNKPIVKIISSSRPRIVPRNQYRMFFTIGIPISSPPDYRLEIS